MNFHKFVGNLVHLSSVSHHQRARELAKRFEEAVRGDEASLTGFLSVHSPKGDDPVEVLIPFCVYHRDSILRELGEAKVAAAAIAQRTDKWSRVAIHLLFALGAIHPDSILPEHDQLDLDLPEPRLNVQILRELLRRSEQGESLTHGLSDFVDEMSEAVR